MTAAVLAHEPSLPLLTIRLDSLMSRFMDETASKLRLIFDYGEPWLMITNISATAM